GGARMSEWPTNGRPPQSPVEPCRADPPQSRTALNGSVGASDGSMGGHDERDGSVRDATAARFDALGIDTTPAKPKPFPCILPGHDHQARVYTAKRGFWRYRCN